VLESLSPELTIFANEDGSYILGFNVFASGAATSPSMVAIRNIRSVGFAVFDADGTLIDSLSTEEVTTSGVMQSGTQRASLSASASVVYRGRADAGSYVVMTAHTDNGMVARKRYFAIESDDDIESIHMHIETRTLNTGIRFLLHATRVTPPPQGEYLSSTERFRIEIESSYGETIWSSANGRFFSDTIKTVEPNEVGEEKVFEALFDGRSDVTHGPLSPGTYRIIATIPAKPNPYIIREEFTFRGR
jgi:hypothetical protein